jgi:hypothetical protein
VTRLSTVAECDHRWGFPTRLPRATQQQCSRCRDWRLLLDQDLVEQIRAEGGDPTPEIILPQANLDRALALLRTEAEIRDLPETLDSD